jgi:hypothetical protein
MKNNQTKPKTMPVPPGYTLLLITDMHTGGQFPMLLQTTEQGGVLMQIREHCSTVFNMDTVYDWDTNTLSITLTPKEIYDLAQLVRVWAN